MRVVEEPSHGIALLDHAATSVTPTTNVILRTTTHTRNEFLAVVNIPLPFYILRAQSPLSYVRIEHPQRDRRTNLKSNKNWENIELQTVPSRPVRHWHPPCRLEYVLGVTNERLLQCWHTTMQSFYNAHTFLYWVFK
jgi:hypothetical protein